MEYQVTANIKWKGRRGKRPAMISLTVPFKEMSFLNLGKNIPPLKQYGDFLAASDKQEVQRWVERQIEQLVGSKPSSFSLSFSNDLPRW